mgnify:CR=1 FL=1
MMKDYEKFKETIASKGALEALKDKGISISEDVIKGLSDNPMIAKLMARKAEVEIQSMEARNKGKPTDSHYVDVAYGEHLKSGGKPAEFKEGLKQFVRKEQERMPIKKREIVNG